MDIFVFVIWALAGIVNVIACSNKIKADWCSYWICYGCLMLQLLDNLMS